MTYQNTIHKPQIQYTLTAVSENRKSDSYHYEAQREEESRSSILTAVTATEHQQQHQRREEQQQQLEQERQMMSGIRLSAQILKALNSLEALVIFQRVADSGINGIDNMSLGRAALPLITRKQFYMRMAGLKQVGLISRTSGKYRLTSLGLVVRSSLGIIYKGIKFKWALGMLDAAEAGAKQQRQQRQRQDHHNLEPQIKDILIDNLVTDETIKEILMIQQEQVDGQL
jgi:hypothetical protein